MMAPTKAPIGWPRPPTTAMMRRSIDASTPFEPGEIWLLSHTIRMPPIEAISAAKA